MNKTKGIKTCLILALTTIMTAVSSQAAEITFSDRTEVLNDATGSAVLTNGSHVVAGNVYGGLPNPVLNGVTFPQFWFGLPVTGNGVTLTLYDLSSTSGYAFTDATTYYSADTNLAALMSKSTLGAYYAPGFGITMSNLTIGVEYQLQGFYWDKASGSIQYIRNADNYENRGPTFQTSASAVGYSWTATWVADSTVQSIEVMPGASSRALLAGVSLRAMGIPEFGTPVSVPDDSGSVIMNDGVYVLGVNAGNSADIVNTVNGVDFLSGGISGTTQVRSANGVTATITNLASGFATSGQASGIYTDTGSPDEVYDVVDGGFVSPANGSINITLSGLTVDRTYRLQTFHLNNSGSEAYRRIQYSVNGTFVSSYFSSFFGEDIFAVANTVTFIANATTVSIDIQAANTVARSYLNGFSLYHFDVPTDPYIAWIFQYPGVGTATNWTDDPDGDGLDNLSEYGLGGNPDDDQDQGTAPQCGIVEQGGTSYFGYVYPQLTNTDSGLSYSLEICTDLITGAWTNAGYTVLGTNVTGGSLDMVTNYTDTADSQKFIRLMIEKN